MIIPGLMFDNTDPRQQERDDFVRRINLEAEAHRVANEGRPRFANLAQRDPSIRDTRSH